MSEAWIHWEGHVVNSQFQLNKYLGGSEQSAVFLTNNPGQEFQLAAIKLVAASTGAPGADPANAEHQLAQWQAAQRLSHPNLIRLFDTGRYRLGTRDVIFAVMEYAEENLAQILPERPLTLQETREMLGPTLDALAYLHGQGFVHGRLKPGNVLAANDQLKLASDSVRPIGESVSSPEKPSVYDPPEMATAGGTRSPAADVWSLGMTLAEVLTQRPPSWPAPSDAQTDPVLPENLPMPFQEMVRGCLRRDPQQRLTIAGIAARLHAKPSQQAARVADTPLPQERSFAVSARFHEGPPQQPARVADPKPLAQNLPAVRGQGTSWIWPHAFPLALAVVGVAALLAGFGFLRHPPQTQSDNAAVKPEHKPQSPGSPTRVSRGGVKVPGSPTRVSRNGVEVPKPDAGHALRETTDRQLRAGNRPDATPASPMRPQPASMRAEAGTGAGSLSPAANSGARVGDMGAGVVQQILPNVPQSASDTIQGTIRVRVKVNVDPSGKVAEADLDSPGPSKYFARLALEAAQKWKFAPSSQGAGREFALQFEFRNSGTRAFATRANP
jgi:TonB family protein